MRGSSFEHKRASRSSSDRRKREARFYIQNWILAFARMTPPFGPASAKLLVMLVDWRCSS
jgi:hypothetical protein